MKNDLTLLYAEDDPEILENMKFLLSRYAKNIYTAKNGKEALDLYNEHKPDIFISDLMMPIMNGFEVAKKIRENNKTIPIIFITAHSDDEHLKEASNIPSSSYLLKPFNLDTLNQAIEKALKEQVATSTSV